MFYVRRAAGAYFRYAHAHKALHWRAWPKPWGLGDGATSPEMRAISPWELSRTYTYLRSSTSSLLRAADHGATHCAAALTPHPSPVESLTGRPRPFGRCAPTVECATSDRGRWKIRRPTADETWPGDPVLCAVVGFLYAAEGLYDRLNYDCTYCLIVHGMQVSVL